MNVRFERQRQCNSEHDFTGTSGLTIVLLVAGLLSGCQQAMKPEPVAACASDVAGSGWGLSAIEARGENLDLVSLVDRLASAPVVLIGEQHDRLDHHLTQLEIICRLHARDPALTIGVEFLQRPFQAEIDRYLEGRSDTEGLLLGTEYYERWRFDFRLYEPILRFARGSGIPVIALNAAAEITAKVGQDGLNSLSPEDRAQVAADIGPPGEAYLERLRSVFEAHPQTSGGSLERFTEVQLLWDETMAETAANYLLNHPGERLVIIAGSGHVDYRDAIAARIARRIDDRVVIVSQAPADDTAGGDADFRVVTEQLMLPLPGRMGVFLNTTDSGVKVDKFAKNSAAEAAGVLAGDVIVSVDGRSIATYIDIKLAFWRKLVGDTVEVKIRSRDQAKHYHIVLR